MPPRIRTLIASDLNAVTDLLAQHFVNGSVLHQALQIEPDAWRPGSADDLDNGVSSGCSVIALAADNETIVGCVVAWALTPRTPAQLGAATTGNNPLSALLASLQQKAIAPSANTLHVDMAVVSPDASGSGLYRQMREAVHTQARNLGFNRVRGELSSASTQHVCIDHFGHRVLSEIAYADFQHQGTRPFSAIASPTSLKLVEGAL